MTIHYKSKFEYEFLNHEIVHFVQSWIYEKDF